MAFAVSIDFCPVIDQPVPQYFYRSLNHELIYAKWEEGTHRRALFLEWEIRKRPAPRRYFSLVFGLSAVTPSFHSILYKIFRLDFTIRTTLPPIHIIIERWRWCKRNGGSQGRRYGGCHGCCSRLVCIRHFWLIFKTKCLRFTYQRSITFLDIFSQARGS